VSRSAFVIPVLGYLGYPLAVAGGLLIFGTCSLLTLDMISANIDSVVTPIAASADFNVPPVAQIGSLGPAEAAEEPAPAPVPVPETSILTIAPPQQPVAIEVAPVAAATIATIEPPGLGSGQVGDQAVNVRAAPSKDGAKLGVLNAGSAVRLGENTDGWVHVFFSGGDGWVYETYLAGY
jgi:hypothetical protein